MTDRTTGSKGRRRLWLLLKLVGTVAGFGYIAAIVDLAEVGSAMTRVPVRTIAMAIALVTGSVVVASVRWRILLRTYGAPNRPPVRKLFRLYLVGLFYNTFLPGAVGGDVVRGIVSREAFGPAGVTAALTVVFVERVLGLTGLLVLTATTLALRPVKGIDAGIYYSVVGLVIAGATLIAIAAARRLGPLLPGRLERIAARVPAIDWIPGLMLAVLLSLVTHTLIAVTGYAILTSVAPEVTLADAFVIVPVAAAAAFFPLTVGGAGVREAAFVALCTHVLAIPQSSAAAASLLVALSQYAVAAVGGLLQLVVPVRLMSDSP